MKFDQDKFEKSLITHNHLDLMRRISIRYNCGFSNLHNEFLALLSNFYKTMRYDRYILNNIQFHDKERSSLIKFLEKHLAVEIEYMDIFVTSNEWRFKRFIGKIVGKICEVFYGLVKIEAELQNIYTYELRTESKASAIFLSKKYNFYDDQIVWKEIVIFLMNTHDSSGILDFIREIDPLNFDPELVNQYIDVFNSDLKKHNYIYEVDEYYQELENKKERMNKLELLGDSKVFFNSVKRISKMIDSVCIIV